MAEIGKNVIENLTTAMYENSYTVYREYIQNAADSIDKAIESRLLTKNEAYIDIDIDINKRTIKIYDNACGIPQKKFYKVLSDIADSQKDRTKDKGFRGIGRLAGIAYCRKLVFKSSYKGEPVKSIMTWDGELLRTILSDKYQHPSASELVDKIITCNEEKWDVDDHFFEVVLEGIIPESDNLLNEHEVIQYLQAVAPIPYINAFYFRSKIYEFAKQNNFLIDEYKIEINGNQIYKPYKTLIYRDKEPFDEIKDIQFEIVKNNNGEVLGWMWYSLSKFEKQIPIINSMRGIRIRKENIQIGNEETLGYPKFYKEPRGNLYFFGELFATHTELIPNARRDYFNTNSTLKEFENAVYPILHDDLCKLYHFANEVKNSAKKVSEYEKSKNEYDEKLNKGRFVSKEDQDRALEKLTADKEKAEKAQHKLELRKKEAEKNQVLNRVFTEINNTYTVDKPKQTDKKMILRKTRKRRKTLIFLNLYLNIPKKSRS